MSIYDLSLTPANNASVSGMNWAEGQAPSTVNNSARQLLTIIAQMVGDIGGSLTAGGTPNALTLTANSSFTTYADGRIIAFRASADNTGAATLNVNGIGAKALRKFTTSGEAALSANDIRNGGIYLVVYSGAANSAAGAWVVLNAPTDLSGVQPLNDALTSISGLTTAADKMIYTTAEDTYAVADLTAFARTLLDDEDAETAMATLGAAGSAITVTGAGLASGGGALTENRTITVTEASQVEAEAGTASDVVMTPRRVKDALDARIYTGSSANATSLPVTHTVLVQGASSSTSFNRNSTTTLNLHSGDASSYVNSSHGSAGSALSGTWRARGFISGTGGSMFQRVA